MKGWINVLSSRYFEAENLTSSYPVESFPDSRMPPNLEIVKIVDIVDTIDISI